MRAQRSAAVRIFIAAALIAGVLSVITTAIGGDALQRSATPLAAPAWLWLMTTLGTWLVLAAGKVCERSPGEWIKRLRTRGRPASETLPPPTPTSAPPLAPSSGAPPGVLPEAGQEAPSSEAPAREARK